MMVILVIGLCVAMILSALGVIAWVLHGVLAELVG